MCFFIFMRGILSIVSRFCIDGMCVVALAPATSTMSGATFQPLVIMLLMSGWYFVVFLSRVSAVNLSLQYVNSMNCIVIPVVGVYGGGWLYGCPMTLSAQNPHPWLRPSPGGVRGLRVVSRFHNISICNSNHPIGINIKHTTWIQRNTRFKYLEILSSLVIIAKSNRPININIHFQVSNPQH